MGITLYDIVKSTSVTTSYPVRQLFFLSKYAGLNDAEHIIFDGTKLVYREIEAFLKQFLLNHWSKETMSTYLYYTAKFNPVAPYFATTSPPLKSES